MNFIDKGTDELICGYIEKATHLEQVMVEGHMSKDKNGKTIFVKPHMTTVRVADEEVKGTKTVSSKEEKPVITEDANNTSVREYLDKIIRDLETSTFFNEDKEGIKNFVSELQNSMPLTKRGVIEKYVSAVLTKQVPYKRFILNDVARRFGADSDFLKSKVNEKVDNTLKYVQEQVKQIGDYRNHNALAKDNTRIGGQLDGYKKVADIMSNTKPADVAPALADTINNLQALANDCVLHKYFLQAQYFQSQQESVLNAINKLIGEK